MTKVDERKEHLSSTTKDKLLCRMPQKCPVGEEAREGAFTLHKRAKQQDTDSLS